MSVTAPNDIIGPYEEAGSYKIARLVGAKMVADSVKARHILIKLQNNDTTAAMNKADSLKNLIKKGQKFDDLAKKFSEDPGSAVKGGDLGWFPPGKMVGPFNDACFDGKKGDMPIVQSQFGVHLVEITDKGAASTQVQIAIVARKVEPSQKTYDSLYNKAQNFAATYTNGKAFDSAIVSKGLNKRVADNLREADKTVPGLEQPRELVRWAYKANKDEISKVFTFGDKYVVAHLVDIKEKGTLPLEEVERQVTIGAKKDKKAEMLMEKFKTKSAGATTIDAIAQTLGVNLVSAENVNFAGSYIQGIGNEPRLLGLMFTMKQGQVTPPVKGMNGVFVASVEKINEPAEPKDLSASQKQLGDQRKQRSEYEVFNALKEKAKVEDYRGKFY
jgi:peptidyl-prolyl cis-trans isomerase D